ncbi:ferrochelatase [Desulforhopalus vacuolatus]|uniref:ferrochelatase n=1 Tax=Desulforhopalus vacuolatus TaxID=40414 RepID=UPI0019629D36|nr:ferrochelatase [Desulforhopalus vacuolatus]MBM9518361.1 ferrochelatase [Desulforhopalus vacuolatus]
MTKSRGVILLNMGGPNSLKAVRPFLYNLFSDREIIPLGPPFLQKFIAWMIARKRAPISQETYRKIGGASPLERITRAQAKALEKNLCQEGEDWHVSIAMRYWPPYADEALDEMLANKVEDITAVSLYPHYTKATTGSSLNHLRAAMTRRKINIPLRVVESWPEEPGYIYTLAEGIKKTLVEMKEKTSEEITVVYSAHSLPVSFIQEGDPYVEHLKQTIAEVEKQTEVTGILCFQSRSGPVEWLAPSTPETVNRLAAEGCKAMVMVPISFVSDHVETLYEIDMLYRSQAEDLGMVFASTPSLNTDARFIDALASLVKKAPL